MPARTTEGSNRFSTATGKPSLAHQIAAKLDGLYITPSELTESTTSQQCPRAAALPGLVQWPCTVNRAPLS